MNKQQKEKVSKYCSQTVVNALEAGTLNRVVGAGGTANPGDKFFVLSADIDKGNFKPDNIADEEWDALSNEEKEAQGVVREWVTFRCKEGNFPLTRLFGSRNSRKEEFWEDSEEMEKYRGEKSFDEVFFKPSTLNVQDFILNGCDGIIGKTIHVVDIREEVSDIFTQNRYLCAIED